MKSCSLPHALGTLEYLRLTEGAMQAPLSKGNRELLELKRISNRVTNPVWYTRYSVKRSMYGTKTLEDNTQ